MPLTTNQEWINIRRAAFIFVAGLIATSCSEKSAPNPEKDVNASEPPRQMMSESEMEGAEDGAEAQPDKDEIEEDCAALVRSTRVVPARAAATDCPGCPAGGTSVLAFRGMKTDAISCSGDTCTVVVTIRAMFNPGSGETIAGGLAAWIPPETRKAYLSGQVPSGEQVYRVRIAYTRRGTAWRAVEFDRAPAE